jgi:lipoate-protein ligase A
MKVFDVLRVWLDPEARPGPEAMAVDEWLLETAREPVMRVYRWAGGWGSLGYFGKLAEARSGMPGIRWVRRWTGGGMVDHRADWTYTVVAPAFCGISRMRGAESYRVLHDALAGALRMEGLDVRSSAGTSGNAGAMCFHNPVGHDLIDAAGRKLAGAGQRRTRGGLLHQGSVAVPCGEAASALRADRLAARLAVTWHQVALDPPSDWLRAKTATRYGRPEWTNRC